MPDIEYISRRDQILMGERYILIMEGMAKSESRHPHGVTIVVNNARNNPERVIEGTQALARAIRLSDDENIRAIYVMRS